MDGGWWVPIVFAMLVIAAIAAATWYEKTRDKGDD